MDLTEKLKTLIFRFSGFSLIGGLNTLLSILLVCVMNELLGIPYPISYIVSYIATVLLGYLANAYFVFHSPVCLKGALLFFLSYISGMLLGTLLLWLAKRLFPAVNASLLSCCVIPVTMVWNFVLINKILPQRRKENIHE